MVGKQKARLRGGQREVAIPSDWAAGEAGRQSKSGRSVGRLDESPFLFFGSRDEWSAKSERGEKEEERRERRWGDSWAGKRGEGGIGKASATFILRSNGGKGEGEEGKKASDGEFSSAVG